MTTTAWVFPGQGSQALGMDTDLATVPLARDRFAIADEILGWSVQDLCRSTTDRLARTRYTQPCLYVIECILADLLRERVAPDYLAGHSLGEYVALYVGGAFDFATGLRLVQQRAELMDAAAGGTMVALMKFDRERLQALVAATPDVVLANDNSEQQVVISGAPEAVETVLSQVKARRAVPLPVSGAFHSPLMAGAAAQFAAAIAAVPFADTTVPLLSNVDPTPVTRAAPLKARLSEQMTGPVRWREIMLQLAALGVTDAIEVGPGNVLTGLLKRTTDAIALHTVGTAAACTELAAV